MAVYTIKQSDINTALAAGVTMKLDGLAVSSDDVLTTGSVLVATCSGGKKFFKVPAEQWGYPEHTSINIFGWDNSEGEDTYKNFILSAGDTVATFTTPAGMLMQKRMEIVTKSASVALAWVNNPSSGSSTDTLAFSWVGGSSPYTVVVLTPSGTEQDNAQITSTSYNFHPEHGAGVYSVTVSSGSESVTQQVTISAVLPKALYTVKATDIEQLTANEVDVKVNGADVVEGSVLRIGDVLTANVSGNRFFYVRDTEPLVNSIYFKCWDADNGEYVYNPFTLSNSNQTAVYTMVDNSTNDLSYDKWVIATKIETPKVVGNNNVYEIDSDKLSQINKERFTVIPGSDAPYDYGQYILSVLQFPFAVPSDIIGGPDNIQLADKTLTVSAPKLLDDAIKIDMGVITVPEKVGNLLDYVKTKAVLHLPRSPSIVLDLEYVIGQTLGIFYILDAYTGTATINVTSTKLDGVISSSQVDIGVKVPYMANVYSQPENTGVVAGGANGVITPYIEIIRNESILSNGFFTVPVVDESLIGDQSGFVKIENVDLSCSALSDEKAKIISTLTNGVIIK